MAFNPKLHPKHLWRILNPRPAARIRQDDIPDVEEFEWHTGQETRSIWCSDSETGETLFVVPPPRTMREALLLGFMAGKARGWKDRDFYGGEDLIQQIFGADIAHYQVTGYWPDEAFTPPMLNDEEPPEMDDLPEQTVDGDIPPKGRRARLVMPTES